MVIPYITFNGDCRAALMFYEDGSIVKLKW